MSLIVAECCEIVSDGHADVPGVVELSGHEIGIAVELVILEALKFAFWIIGYAIEALEYFFVLFCTMPRLPGRLLPFAVIGGAEAQHLVHVGVIK